MEIRVRGKSKVTGRWVYGDLIHYESGDVTILEKPFSAYGYEATQMDRRTQVLPETVGLSTTLHDKHGKEIWEGDRVNIEIVNGVWRPDTVLFTRGMFIKESTKTPLGWVHPQCLEVIGNIYEEGE